MLVIYSSQVVMTAPIYDADYFLGDDYRTGSLRTPLDLSLITCRQIDAL